MYKLLIVNDLSATVRHADVRDEQQLAGGEPFGVLLPGPLAAVGEGRIFRRRCLTCYEIYSHHPWHDFDE